MAREPGAALADADSASSVREAFAAVFANEQTFDTWYQRMLPRVYGYVFSRCGRDEDLAEDLTQQAFIDAVRSHDRFDGQSDPATWLCGIARHKVADHFRRLDAEERSRLRLIERLAETATQADTADVVEREAISSALATLPALQRAVLTFAALDGLSTREVADLIGRSEGATESLLHRARASFRRAYRGEEGQGDA